MNAITQPTILVADLDTGTLAQTVRILSELEFTVFSAVCYSSAMSAAMKLDLDLLICDVTVQHCNAGHDLIAEVHRLPDNTDVPIIFTSSGQGPDVIRRQHDFGGAYHIKKPLESEVLKEIVDCALWLPHLVQSHINKPHFPANPAVFPASASGPVIANQTAF